MDPEWIPIPVERFVEYGFSRVNGKANACYGSLSWAPPSTLKHEKERKQKESGY